MQIIVPMSGFGERFRRAGYAVPKPLIEIEGKPIVAHVIDLFPGETDFLFICNQDHLDNPEYRMAEILNQYCPTGKIVGIPPHKLGPVHAVLQVEDLIKGDAPAVVNYCDFTCYWDWPHFKKFALDSQALGIIPAYKGFHPHTLGTTNYAYIREGRGRVIDIQEKQPYTNNRMEEYASSGTYYFSSGNVLKDAFHRTVAEGLNTGGEYYVSLTYKPLLADGENVQIYALQHFMQWGTPEDVTEYNEWSKIFKRLLLSEPSEALDEIDSLVVPMAGLGQRFANEGYKLTKPLIPVSGRAMAVQAILDLPRAKHRICVVRSDMSGRDDIADELSKVWPEVVIHDLASVTEGQAISALAGVASLRQELGIYPTDVTFGACDNGVLYDRESLRRLMSDPEVDVIVWGARGHNNALRNPCMFGWIREDCGKVKEVSVKVPLSDPATDPIVIGAFTFKKVEYFERCVAGLIGGNVRVNGEFYIDSCVNEAVAAGLNCVLFEVDHFISWGTPNDLKTFEYWQSCFHKWPTHPYDLSKDARVPPAAVRQLGSTYASFQRSEVEVVPK